LKCDSKSVLTLGSAFSLIVSDVCLINTCRISILISFISEKLSRISFVIRWNPLGFDLSDISFETRA